MEYYSATKVNESLIHATMLMYVSNTIQMKVSQKVIYYMISFIWKVQNRKATKKQTREYLVLQIMLEFMLIGMGCLWG